MRRLARGLVGASVLAGLAATTSADGAGESRLFLAPNAQDAAGAPIFVHVTEADMPWRVAIAVPPEAPRNANCREGRDAAIESMRSWESAIQPRLPWFRLEFVEHDPAAPVQIHWLRRVAKGRAGFGEVSYEQTGGRYRVLGRMEVSTTPGLEERLTVDELRLVIAHEFGHVLGLGHCLDCDSAMNYSWQTRGRVFVTETDVGTFLALIAQPNGSHPP